MKLFGRQKVWKLLVLILSFAAILGIYTRPLQAQDDNKLKKAQWFFQHENYEEALDLFLELKAEQPDSSQIAYLLGVTYKRMQDYLAAKTYLEEALTFSPKVDNAFPELIDLLYQVNSLDEAKQWVAQAQDEEVAPAQIAFLKGLVLLKEGLNLEAAIQSFEQAESLDPALAQTAKYQKGLVYLRMKDFISARKIFREIAAKNEDSSLAKFAKEYLNIIKKQLSAGRPLRGYFGYSLQYDDNVLFTPDNKNLVHDVSTDNDWRHVFSGQVDYNFKPVDNFGVRTGLSFYGTKQDEIGFYDMMSYDFHFQPSFYPERKVISFPVHYNYVSVNDKKYLSVLGAGCLVNVLMGRNQMLQVQSHYNTKDYHWAADRDDDDKKGHEYVFSGGWFRFFGKDRDGFINLRYTLNNEDSKGNNWKYLGNRLTFTSVCPLTEKIKWSLVGDYFRRDFLKENTTYDKGRRDNVYTVSNFLSYEIVKDTEINLQHTFTFNGSSIGAYKYRKNIYGTGVRYRF